jgi:hypothetical protein
VAASGRKLFCGPSTVLEKWNGLRSWTSRILFVITQDSRRRHLAENRRKAALLGIGNILLLDPPGMILRPDAEFVKKTTSIGIPMLRFCSLEPVVLGFEQLPKQSPPQEHMRLPVRQNPTPTRGADLRCPSLNSIREAKPAQLTEGLAKHDFGYLQPISLKEENRLWARSCRLNREKTECFAANVGEICPMT